MESWMPRSVSIHIQCSVANYNNLALLFFVQASHPEMDCFEPKLAEKTATFLKPWCRLGSRSVLSERPGRRWRNLTRCATSTGLFADRGWQAGSVLMFGGAQTKQNHIMLRVDFSMFQLDDLSWLIFVQKGWDHESLFRLCLHASNVLSYLASIWLVIANAERVRPFIVVPPSWKTCQIPTKMIPN
jgi:hypothetical protein